MWLIRAWWAAALESEKRYRGKTVYRRAGGRGWGPGGEDFARARDVVVEYEKRNDVAPRKNEKNLLRGAAGGAGLVRTPSPPVVVLREHDIIINDN